MLILQINLIFYNIKPKDLVQNPNENIDMNQFAVSYLCDGYSFLFPEGVNWEEQGNGSETALLRGCSPALWASLFFLFWVTKKTKQKKKNIYIYIYMYGKIDYLPFIFKLFNQTTILSKYLGKYFYFGTWYSSCRILLGTRH